MTKKNIFPVVATIAVVGIVLGVFSMTVMRDSNVSISTMTSEQAYANLSSKMKRIGVQEVSVNPQQLDVSEFLDAKDELPDIESSYPFVVEGNGDVNIEVFSSGEKAAESGSDSFLTSWQIKLAMPCEFHIIRNVIKKNYLLRGPRCRRCSRFLFSRQKAAAHHG